ncbi:type II toxin-antitoxin system RelE/ParE family toxin [Marivirga harenae]|uniref:type II toxin-antitoxin system RelE/ParE family toxin n=1 Tax=Marivirga harenae TaxID=2010992 RepID=UPI0026E0DE07|nr:type II toxin-antitoxin system RelE/ParE family toxin [Marivirga harenae]WKV10762.1 type II toxin-antitoxin system RelE/ParE family toxin [Marivirga harenae]
MEVVITEPAEKSLKSIYCRFEEDIAVKITNKILDRADTLQTFSNRGRLVDELQSLQQEHRYIIERNYKIIAKQKNAKVYVTDVLDMNNDPEKIKINHQS